MTKPIYPENRLPDEWQMENADPKAILRSALYILTWKFYLLNIIFPFGTVYVLLSKSLF